MDDDPPNREWSDESRRPVDELCELVVARHHSYAYRTIADITRRLEALAACGDAEPALVETRAAFVDLARELLDHFAKEEIVVFPALSALAMADREGGRRPALPFPTVLYPIRLMETEHLRIEAAMARVRELTHGFAAGADASALWRACLSACADLDHDLQRHFRVENELLFPRALELERRFG